MIHTLIGKNSFLIDQELAKIISESHCDTVVKLDGEVATFEEVMEPLTSQSLFGDMQCVVVRNLARNKSVADHFIEKIDLIPPLATGVLIENDIDKRSAFYKSLKKSTQLQSFEAIDASQLTGWLVETAKRTFDIQLDRATAQHLVERVGTDQLLLSSELEKLATTDKPLSKTLINELVEQTPQESIFELLDSIMDGRIQHALDIYDRLRFMRTEPMYILSMIIWQLHILTLVVVAEKRSPDEIARQAKLSPFVVRKLSTTARKLQKKDTLALWKMVCDTDHKVKTTNVEMDLEIKLLLTEMSSYINQA